MLLEIPTLEDVLKGPLGQRGDWLVAGLDAALAWPVRAQEVDYRGDHFWLVPITTTTGPALALRLDGQDRRAASRRAMRFLSVLSWVCESGIGVRGIGGGSMVRPPSRPTVGAGIANELELDYLPEVEDDETALALALLREGRSLDHPGYAFLSFFRALERAFGNDQKAKKEWMPVHLELIRDGRAREAIEELRVAGCEDVADHLYRTRRHAIAHAGGKGPVVDPDDPEQSYEIRREGPIVLELAKLAIEQRMGVKTRSTIYREHLYELAGLRPLIPQLVVEKIMANEPLEEGLILDLPVIDVELKGRSPYSPLQQLSPLYSEQRNGALGVTFESRSKRVKLRLWMNFAAERLEFDWQADIGSEDDGTAEAALEGLEVLRFIDNYIGNGKLNIFDAETRELLSRVDSFLPVNYWGNRKWFDAERARLTQVAERRARFGWGAARWADAAFRQAAPDVRVTFDEPED
jgi:hypothetical protein